MAIELASDSDCEVLEVPTKATARDLSHSLTLDLALESLVTIEMLVRLEFVC